MTASAPRRAAGSQCPPGRARAGGATIPKADELRRLSDQLDELLRDESNCPSTSHRETERRIGAAEAIASGLVKLYRKPSAKPLFLEQDGERTRAGW